MRNERKILRFVSQKLRKSFANGNPSRAILNGLDGWVISWVLNGNNPQERKRRQKGGRGVHYLGWISGEEIIGPIKVEDCVKFRSKGYCELLEDHSMP